MSESFKYTPSHDPDYEMIDGKKVFIENESRRKNRDRLNFREYLEKLKLVQGNEEISEAEFRRVNEIAYISSIKEEDIVPLAALDFMVNRLRKDGYSSADIFEASEEELNTIVSKYLSNRDRQNTEVLFSVVTTALVESVEHNNFIEILFRKIEERNKKVDVHTDASISVVDGEVKVEDKK